jgi:glycine hydroxymethyltransferase
MLREAATPAFQEYARQTVENARVLAETLEGAGLRLVSGGTETHLVLVDVTPLGLVGNVAATALEAAGIVTNYNTIPFDPQPPTIGSGVRMGTPALTTRGMRTDEMRRVGTLIAQALEAHEDPTALANIRDQVSQLCEAFPAPGLPH